MPIFNLEFDYINTSAQVGDAVYYTSNGIVSGGFDAAPLASTTRLGYMSNIQNNIIEVDSTYATNPMQNGDYVSFAKEKKINTSSLVGYYASVKLVNNSTDKAELFSIGSEISESSK